MSQVADLFIAIGEYAPSDKLKMNLHLGFFRDPADERTASLHLHKVHKNSLATNIKMQNAASRREGQD